LRRQGVNPVVKINSPECLRLLMSPYPAAVSIQSKNKKPDLGLLVSAFAQGFGATAFARPSSLSLALKLRRTCFAEILAGCAMRSRKGDCDVS
jgi:hypothetical protein